MEQNFGQWEVKGTHRGTFSDYSVRGSEYQSVTGEIGWRVSLWPLSGFEPPHEYWVSGGDFFRVTTDFGTSYARITLSDPIVTATEQAEKNVALEAIARFENARCPKNGH